MATEYYLADQLNAAKESYARGAITLDQFEELAARTVRYQQNALDRRMSSIL